MRRLPHLTPLPNGSYQCVTPEGYSAIAPTREQAFNIAAWMAEMARKNRERKPPRGGLKPGQVAIDRTLLKWLMDPPKDPYDGVLRFGAPAIGPSRSLRERLSVFNG